MVVTSGNCVVPVALWGSHPPSHNISSLLYISSGNSLVTGSRDGQLIICSVKQQTGSSSKEQWKIIPHCVLLGHTSAVRFLECVSTDSPGEKPYFVSITDTGEMCLWDLQNARCVELKQSKELHESVQAYHRQNTGDIVLLCCGKYPHVTILNPLSLEPLFQLSMRNNANWILSLTAFYQKDIRQDVVLGITNTGNVFVWTLSGNEEEKYAAGEKIFEGEFKTIRSVNSTTFKCCPYNPRTLLLVNSKVWQVYDAVDMTLLCSEQAPRLQRWTGGDFVSLDAVVLYSNLGVAYLYKLPVNAVVSCSEFRTSGASTDTQHTIPMAFRRMRVTTPKEEAPPNVLDSVPHEGFSLGATAAPPLILCPMKGGRECGYILFRGDVKGHVHLWRIESHPSKASTAKSRLTRQETIHNLPDLPHVAVGSLMDIWQEHKPIGIADFMVGKGSGHEIIKVSASVMMHSLAKLAIGLENGEIVITSVTDCLANQFFKSTDPNTDLDLTNLPPTHLRLSGHQCRINFLLYPDNSSSGGTSRYDPMNLVSGADDFSVTLWDVVAGTKLHRFVPHGGPVLTAFLPPSTCTSNRVLQSIVTVAADGSVCLLNLKERKVLLIASRHLFPVCGIAWRPAEDFMLVSCLDGSLYVWQTEVAALDRVVHGSVAEDIWSAAEYHQIMRHQHYQGAAGPGAGLSPSQTATLQRMRRQTAQQRASSGRRSCPLKVKALRLSPRDVESHVLLFDTETLIVSLLADEQKRAAIAQAARAAPSRPPPPRPGAPAHQHRTDGSSPHDSPNAQRKIAGLMAKMKTGAENIGHKIQHKAEQSGLKVTGLLGCSTRCFTVSPVTPSPNKLCSDMLTTGAVCQQQLLTLSPLSLKHLPQRSVLPT